MPMSPPDARPHHSLPTSDPNFVNPTHLFFTSTQPDDRTEPSLTIGSANPRYVQTSYPLHAYPTLLHPICRKSGFLTSGPHTDSNSAALATPGLQGTSPVNDYFRESGRR